jgi:hypothetical protein
MSNQSSDWKKEYSIIFAGSLLVIFFSVLVGSINDKEGGFAFASSVVSADILSNANAYSLRIGSNGVVLSNIHTVPSSVYVGDFFKLNATVLNRSPNNITLAFVGCSNPLSATFEKNVDILQHGVCTVFRYHKVNLAAGGSTTLSTPVSILKSIHQYKATSAGKATAVLQLLYSQGPSTRLVSYKQPFVLTILSKSVRSSHSFSSVTKP